MKSGIILNPKVCEMDENAQFRATFKALDTKNIKIYFYITFIVYIKEILLLKAHFKTPA